MDAPALIGLDLYADLFCARRDAYVRNSRVHIDEPITVDLLIDAFTNKWSISGYTASDGLTSVGAIDFDHTDEDGINTVWDTLKKLGIKAVMSQSRRGAHLWIRVGPGDGKGGSELYGRVPAAMVHRALTHAVDLSAHVLATDVEVFPKLTSSPWGVGALRMPLMTHPKSGERYPVITEDGTVVSKIVDLVNTMADLQTPWPVIQKLSKQAPVDYPRNLGEYRRPTRVKGETQPASALLQQMGIENAQPGRSVRCPFHDDSHASMSIADDDERVWCKAPECVAYNGGRGVGSLALMSMAQKGVA